MDVLHAESGHGLVARATVLAAVLALNQWFAYHRLELSWPAK
jgi:hypothetical protein